MNCIKCGKELTTNKQIKYCSQRCCKLYLKSLYKKRNKDRLNEYNRAKRKLGISTAGKDLREKKGCSHLKTNKCTRCGSENDLQVHHIKPRDCGGMNEPNNLILFCRKCHYEYEKLTKNFWKI